MLSFRVDPFQKRDKNNIGSVASPESVTSSETAFNSFTATGDNNRLLLTA